MDAILLVLAAVGWLASCAGAVAAASLGTRLQTDTDGHPYWTGSDAWSRWGMTLTVIGSTAGALATILAVVAGG